MSLIKENCLSVLSFRFTEAGEEDDDDMAALSKTAAAFLEGVLKLK